MADITRREAAGTAQTTDGGTTDIISLSIGSDSIMVLTAQVVAKCTAGAAVGGAAAYFLRACVKSVAGVASPVGAQILDLFEDAALTAADATFAVSGSTPVVRVTGVALNTLDWEARIVGYEQLA